MDNRRRAIMGISKGRLPSEYQEVEYLESTGEQWITTNIILPIDAGIKTTFVLTKYSSISFICGDGNFFFGYYKSESGLYYNRFKNSQNSDIYGIPSYPMTIGTLYNVELFVNNNDLIVNNNIVTTTETPFYAPAITDRTLYIFTLKWLSLDPTYRTIGKIYSLIIYKGENIIHNFIPCYRKADNKAGMYDIVNDVFYTNANTSASTDFIVGPDVN